MIANKQFDLPISAENKRQLEKLKLYLRNIHRFVSDGNHINAVETSLHVRKLCDENAFYTGYIVRSVDSILMKLTFLEIRIGIPFRESKLLPNYQIAQNPVQALINFEKENPSVNFDSTRYLIIGVVCVDPNENIFLPDFTNIIPATFAEIALRNIQKKTDIDIV